MKAVRIAVALAALTTLGAAAPLSPQNAPGAPAPSSGGSCHEECAIYCGGLYPDDSTLAGRCTSSCISSECGGGDFP